MARGGGRREKFARSVNFLAARLLTLAFAAPESPAIRSGGLSGQPDLMFFGALSDVRATLVGPRDSRTPHNDPRRGSARRAHRRARAQRPLARGRAPRRHRAPARPPARRDRRTRRQAAGRDRRPAALDAAVDRRDCEGPRRTADEARRRDLADAPAGRADLAGSSTSCARRRRAEASASCCSRTFCATVCRRLPTRSSTASRVASGSTP